MIDLGQLLGLWTAGVGLWEVSCRAAKEQADYVKSKPEMGPAWQPWEIAALVGAVVFLVLGLPSADESTVVGILVFLIIALALADRRSGQ